MTAKSVPAPVLNSHMQKLLPYPPGRPIEEVQREYGLTHVIKMASNENPLGPSPKAIKAMHAAAGEMHLYPDGAGFYLKQGLAARLGVSPENLVLGNGTDELIMLLGLGYCNSQRGLVTSEYAFVRYRMAAEMAGGPVTLVPMKAMKHDLDALAAAVTPQTAIVALDLPGNPTGTIVTERDFDRFMRKLPEGVLVLLDQAYNEFCAETAGFPDGLKLRGKYPNLVVTRTFSKAYGLAGLRIGYAVARPEIVVDLERLRPPFNANRMAQAAALAALDDAAFLRRAVATNSKGMAQLEKGLTRLGLKFWPSHANFILIDLGRDGGRIAGDMMRLGVITRPMGGYGLVNCLRISIGTAVENRQCLAALKQALGA